MSSVLDCDVVIVNYRAGRLLADCVASVFAASPPFSGAARVIVVDNASDDGSIEHLLSLVRDERLLILRNARNLGFAAACNIGAGVSSSRHVLFLNPDSVLAPDALARMLQVLMGSPAIGMVGGLLCNPDGSEQPGGRRCFPRPQRAFMHAFGLARLARFFPRLCADFLLHRQPLPRHPVVVEAISGACMLVSRAAIAEVGLWDEAYFLHCEDLDWCMRFRQKGWLVVFVPDARIRHLGGACSKSRPVFVEWHKHRGMLRFYRKFYRTTYPGLLWWLVVSAVWLRFALLAAYRGARLGLSRCGLLRN